MTPLDRLTKVVPGVDNVTVWTPAVGPLIVLKVPSG